MPSPLVEIDMRAPVCDLSEFMERGVRFETEVPLGMKRIDLAGLCVDSQVYAVELKVRDWRRAAWQASIYQLCADYAFIAIRADYLHRVDLPYLEGLGIGLISVMDNVARLVLAPTESPFLHRRDHERLRQQLAVTLARSREL